MDNWSYVSGPYTRRTGKDLRELSLDLLYDVTMDAAREMVLRTKEENEALEKLETTIRNQVDMSSGDMPDWLSAFEIKREPMPIAR